MRNLHSVKKGKFANRIPYRTITSTNPLGFTDWNSNMASAFNNLEFSTTNAISGLNDYYASYQQILERVRQAERQYTIEFTVPMATNGL